MKKLLLLLFLPTLASAGAVSLSGTIQRTIENDCKLANGDIVPECTVIPGANGEPPNVVVQFDYPTFREGNVPITRDEFSGAKIYFQKLPENQWTNTVLSPDFKNAFLYRPPGDYSIITTTMDNQSPVEESAPTSAVVVTLVDAPIVPPIDPPIEPPIMPPKPQTITFEFPANSTATVVITPIGVAK